MAQQSYKHCPSTATGACVQQVQTLAARFHLFSLFFYFYCSAVKNILSATISSLSRLKQLLSIKYSIPFSGRTEKSLELPFTILALEANQTNF